jgi:thioredoxin 1
MRNIPRIGIVAASLIILGAGCTARPAPLADLPASPPEPTVEATVPDSGSDTPVEAATATAASPEPAVVPKPVSLEPYYVAYTADGASKALAQGRATVLYFWAAWCPICRAEEPKLKGWIEDSNLPVAGFRVNYDVESELKAKYKIPYQHTTVFLDAKGEEVERFSGPVDEATFTAALEKATE